MTRAALALIIVWTIAAASHGTGVDPGPDPDETERVLVLERLESGRVEVGTINGDRSTRIAVQMRNSAESPVRILAVRSECAACVEIVAVHPEVVPPGEVVTVRLLLRPSPERQTFNSAIRLVTDVAGSDAVRISIGASVRQVRMLPDPLVVSVDARGEVAATFWVISTVHVPWRVEMDASDLPESMTASWTAYSVDAPEAVRAVASDELVVVGRGEVRLRRGAAMVAGDGAPREIRLRVEAPTEAPRDLRLPVVIGGAHATVLTRSISLGIVSPSAELRREVVISGRTLRPEEVVVEASSAQVAIGAAVADVRHGVLRIPVTIRVADAPDGLLEESLRVTIRGDAALNRAVVDIPVIGLVSADLATASGRSRDPAEPLGADRRREVIAIGALGPAADDSDEDLDDEQDESHPGQQLLGRALFSPHGGFVPPQAIGRLARDLHLSQDQERFLRVAYDRYAQDVGPELIRLERAWVADLQRRMLDAFPELRADATHDHLPEDARSAFDVARKAYEVHPSVFGDGDPSSPIAPAMSIAHTLGGEYMRNFHRAMAEADVQRIEWQAALEPPRRAEMLEQFVEILSDEQRAWWSDEARHRFRLNISALSLTDHEQRMHARPVSADRVHERPDIVGLLDAASVPGEEFEAWRVALVGPGHTTEDPLLARVRALRVNAEAALADVAEELMTDSLSQASVRHTARTGESRSQASRAWGRWYGATLRRREVVLQDLVTGLGGLASMHLGETAAHRWYDRVRAMRFPAIYAPDSLDVIGPALRELTEVAVERGSLEPQALEALDQALLDLSAERDRVRRELADASWHRVFALHPDETLQTRRAILEQLSAWIEGEVDRTARLQTASDPTVWRQAEGLLSMRRLEISSYRTSLSLGFKVLE